MVIIPGFGAFISEYLPAVVDDASGEIKPPSSKLIFSQKIKNNDGLLVGQVADATRCTHFEALQKIEKERDNIIYQIDKGEKVELEGIGILLYNAAKEVILVSEEDANLSLENFGLETTHIEEPVEIEEEPEPIETPIHEDNINHVESDIDQPSNFIETIDKIDTKEESENDTTKTIVDNPVFSKKNEEKKKRKGGWVWLLIILIPLLAVAVFIYMKQNNPNEPVKVIQQPETKAVIQDTIPAEDTIVTDSLMLEATDSVTIEEPVQEKQPEIVSGKFYLVGGSFKEQENAETYLQTLKEKGFEPFHMGKYGNYFIVGIGSYHTEEEAMTAKEKYLDENPGSGVWILKR